MEKTSEFTAVNSSGGRYTIFTFTEYADASTSLEKKRIAVRIRLETDHGYNVTETGEGEYLIYLPTGETVAVRREHIPAPRY